MVKFLMILDFITLISLLLLSIPLVTTTYLGFSKYFLLFFLICLLTFLVVYFTYHIVERTKEGYK